MMGGLKSRGKNLLLILPFSIHFNINVCSAQTTTTNGGSSSDCPLSLLDGAFQVEIDFLVDDDGSTDNSTDCSQMARDTIGELIESAMFETSERMVEWSPTSVYSTVNGSVCMEEEEEEEEDESVDNTLREGTNTTNATTSINTKEIITKENNLRISNETSENTEKMSTRTLLFGQQLQERDYESSVAKEESFFPSTTRNLEQHGMFRYYGSMRCSLCTADDNDLRDITLETEVLKYDPVSNSTRCHRYEPLDIDSATFEHWKAVLLDSGPQQSFVLHNISVPVLAEEIRFFFMFHDNSTDWNGQHVYIFINEKYQLDLGPFFANRAESSRSSFVLLDDEIDNDYDNGYRIEWSVQPYESLTQKAVLVTVPRSLYSETGDLDFEITFGNNTSARLNSVFPEETVWPFRLEYGLLGPASECAHYSPPIATRTIATPGQNRRRRQLLRAKQNNEAAVAPSPPAASPVSVPTMTADNGDMDEAISPVWIEPQQPLKTTNTGTKTTTTTTTTEKEDPIKSTTVTEKPITSPVNTTTSTLNTTKPTENTTVTTLTTNNVTDESITDSATTMGIIKSSSNDLTYMGQIRATLKIILEEKLQDMLQNASLVGPEHCMYGKSVRPQVTLVPKPQWEYTDDMLPSCQDILENDK